MKKGQAALEFLTTYGWAFLVILVMIGALAYFGVLNPKNFLPSRCTFSPEINCLEARIDGNVNNDQTWGGTNPGDVNISFRFRNDIGSTAQFNATATFLSGANPNSERCIGLGVAGSETQIEPGRVVEVSCPWPANSAFPKGDKAKFEVNMNFKKVDGTYWTQLKGEIYGTVE